MAAPRYQLVMNLGPTPGKVFPLEKGEIFVGRDLTNDIVINDAEVSRRHARLISQAGGYVLEDLGSTNGTFVNGQRLVGPYILRSGETVTLGEHVSLSFQAEEYDPNATVAMPSYRPATPPVNVPHEPSPVTPVPPVSQGPSYSGQIPANPAPEQYSEPEVPVQRNRTVWIVIIVLGILLLACVCIAALFYIDANSLWCKVFPFLQGCP